MNKREALLEAAGLIVTEQGVQDLTLDAVAQAAAVSKGGLLYHFPSKDALIYGMIEHFVRQFNDLISDEMGDVKDGLGGWLRAYVTVCTTPDDAVSALSRVLISLSASSPQFSAPVLEAYEGWRQRAESDGVAIEVARLVCMAADGCWLYGLHRSGEDEGANRYLLELRKQLLGLIDGSLKARVK